MSRGGRTAGTEAVVDSVYLPRRCRPDHPARPPRSVTTGRPPAAAARARAASRSGGRRSDPRRSAGHGGHRRGESGELIRRWCLVADRPERAMVGRGGRGGSSATRISRAPLTGPEARPEGRARARGRAAPGAPGWSPMSASSGLPNPAGKSTLLAAVTARAAQDRRLPVHDPRAEPQGDGPLATRTRAASDDRRRSRRLGGRQQWRRAGVTPSCATWNGHTHPRPRHRWCVARSRVGLRRHPRGAPGARSFPARQADARRVQQGVAHGSPRRSTWWRRFRRARRRHQRVPATRCGLLPDAAELASRNAAEPAGDHVVHRIEAMADRFSVELDADGVLRPRPAHRAECRAAKLRRVERNRPSASSASSWPARASTRAAPGRSRRR